MKKHFCTVLAVGLVLIFGFSLITMAEDLSAILPDDAELFVKLGSIASIYKHFSVTGNTIMGEPLDEIETIKESLGFNPLLISDLKANGFNIDKPFGFFLSDIRIDSETEEPAFNIVFFLPVTDAKKVSDKLKASITKEEPNVKVMQEGMLTTFKKEGQSETLCIIEKGEYVLFGIKPEADIKPYMSLIAQGKPSVLNTKFYKDVSAKIDTKTDIFAYASIGKIAEKNLETIQRLMKQNTDSAKPDLSATWRYLKDSEGVGISLNLNNKDFVLNGIGNMVPGSKALDISKGGVFDKKMVLSIKENPVLLFSYAVDIPNYYRMITETIPIDDRNSFQNELDGIKTQYGIDIEKDIINNLAGNINLGIYDGMSITMGNYNTILTLNLKDEAKMKSVINTFISKLSPEDQSMFVKTTIGDDEAYAINVGMAQVFIGVKNRNFILSLGKTMYEKSMSGDVAGGFTSGIKDKSVADSLKGNTNVMYMNIDEVFKVAKNFSAFLQQFSAEGKPIDERISQAVSKFEYLFTTNKIEGSTMLSDLMIRTKFDEPFFSGLQKVIKVFKDLKAEAERAAEAEPAPEPEPDNEKEVKQEKGTQGK